MSKNLRIDTNPVFSGKPEDMDSFITEILENLTTDELAYYALQKYATEGKTTEYGYTLPPAVQGGADAVAGIDTDFPMPVHIANSWDKKLAKKVGGIIGDEQRGRVAAANPNTLIFTGLVDLRPNPLNGRYYEAFSEDPYLSAVLCDAVGNGVVGDDGFYIKTQVSTKHFNTYYSEWNRLHGSRSVSARSLYEYYLPAFFKPVENAHMNGVMTAYAGLNGVPNAVSPFLKLLEEKYPYHLLNVSDYNGDGNMLDGIGNGFDEAYAKTSEQVAALLIKAGSYSNNHAADTVTAADFVAAVNDGLFGVTVDDLREYVRPQFELWVRSGYFNQSSYPYASIASDGNPVDAGDKIHQNVALEAAEAGVVLLKNEGGVLPLAKDENILVTGMFADSQVKPFYAAATPSGIDNAGLTFIEGLKAVQGDGGNLTYAPELNSRRIILKESSTGAYLSVGEDNKVYANAQDGKDASLFQLYDWGQDAYSFCDSSAENFLSVDDENNLVLAARDKTATPACFTYEEDGNEGRYIRYGAIITDPSTRVRSDIQYYEYYTTQGNFLKADISDAGIVLGDAVTAGYDGQAVFTETVQGEAGEGASDYTGTCSKAVVFVGADPYVYASEATDRPRIAIGEEQIALVNRVAEAFPGNTIVVISSVHTLGVDEIKNNPNVAGIVLTTYGGEFNALGLANIIYGETSPSGRLAGTWLKDITSLPKLAETEGIDPRYTIDMNDADLVQNKLTYLYNDPSNVTFEFGYGLSYTEFEYDQISYISDMVQLKVSVRVTNTGSRSGADVVQVYAGGESAAYGGYVPRKRLAGFVKTAVLEPAESETVAIEIDREALSRWDVVAGRYIVETGRYQLQVGRSSEHIIWEETVEVSGSSVAPLNLTEPRSVWEAAYAGEGVTAAEVSKQRTSQFNGGYYAVVSDETQSYVILPGVEWDNLNSFTVVAGLAEGSGQILLYAGDMNEEPVCTLDITATGSITYNLDGNAAIPVTELKYESFSADIVQMQTGKADLYMVFRGKGIAVDSVIAGK